MSKIARAILVEELIKEGLKEEDASPLVGTVEVGCNTDLSKLIGCKATYNADEDAIIVYNVNDEQVATITEWAGELYYCTTSLSLLLSLIADSGYTLSELGLE